MTVTIRNATLSSWNRSISDTFLNKKATPTTNATTPDGCTLSKIIKRPPRPCSKALWSKTPSHLIVFPLAARRCLTSLTKVINKVATAGALQSSITDACQTAVFGYCLEQFDRTLEITFHANRVGGEHLFCTNTR